MPHGGTIDALELNPKGLTHEEEEELCFVITTRERRYYLCAESREQFESWVQSITAALAMVGFSRRNKRNAATGMKLGR